MALYCKLNLPKLSFRYTSLQSVRNDEVTFSIGFPEEGQYGLDIYTREIDSSEISAGSNGKQLLTHCCKYLINSSKKNVV
jgi:hypothetical protein